MRFLALLSLMMLLAAPSFAQTPKGAMPEIPEALQALADRGAQLRYLGTEHGLDGWIAIYQGQEQYYYVTGDKKAFVTGLMFGNDGKPITIEQVRELQAQGGDVLDLLAEAPPETQEQAKPLESVTQAMTSMTPGERMFEGVESSNWIALGKDTAPVIYSFIDPQCPHCHEFIQKLRADYIDKGLVQVRIVPVGFLAGSIEQASFLLAAPNPAELFFKHLDGDKEALPTKSDVSTQAIQKNMALMQAWKFNVTPLSTYRSKTGEVKIVRGVAKDIPALIADLSGASAPAAR